MFEVRTGDRGRHFFALSGMEISTGYKAVKCNLGGGKFRRSAAGEEVSEPEAATARTGCAQWPAGHNRKARKGKNKLFAGRSAAELDSVDTAAQRRWPGNTESPLFLIVVGGVRRVRYSPRPAGPGPLLPNSRSGLGDLLAVGFEG